MAGSSRRSSRRIGSSSRRRWRGMTSSARQPRRTRSRSCSKESTRRSRRRRKRPLLSGSETLGRARADAPALSLDVILKDGTTLRLRPPVSADVPALVGFFERLSDRSLYLRFHGFASVGPRLAEPFVDVDWESSGALV